MITAQQIKELRIQTGVSVSACKKALEEADGDAGKALDSLRKESAKTAEKKIDRALGSGVVEAYVHNNKKVGVLVELKSESDFVSTNEEFRALAKDVAMQVAACDPRGAEELLAQSFIKNPSITIKDLINQAVQKFGERIEISRFERYDLAG